MAPVVDPVVTILDV